MPYRITFETLLLCVLMSLQFQLKGQVAERAVGSGADSGNVPVPAWSFPYESIEKAVDGDPAASQRLLSPAGPWKYSGNEADSTRFYAPAFSDSAWSETTGAISGGGTVLLRNTVTVPEAWAQNAVFISPPVNVAATVWVNGQEAGRTGAAAGKTEFDLRRFVRPGRNTLSLKLDLKTQSPLDGLLEDILLYTRPALHFKGIGVAAKLDKTARKGSLKINLTVESRMDSVRERLFGMLRDPIYSTVSIAAKLVDDKGNTAIDFKGLTNKSIRGSDSAGFSMEGTLSDVKPWSHETPDLYRLEISLLDGAGNILEAVSRQVGFRLAEWKSGNLQVNGTPVPLRVFEPDSLWGGYKTKEQLMQDVGQIKMGNFNAVHAAAYTLSPDWYSLANTHGVYVLEASGRGPGSDPARIVVPETGAPAAALPVVDLQLRDFMKGSVGLTNNFAFRDLSAYYLSWEILRNGEKVEEGRVPNLVVEPGAETSIPLGYKTRFYEGNDYFLNLRLKTKAADSLVPADFTVSARQFRLGPYQYKENYQIDKGLIEVSNGPGSIVLNGYDFRIIFDKSSGQISRYSYKGRELLNAGPALTFRKLPAAADSLEKSYDLWNAAAGNANVLDYQITEDVNGNYYISFTSSLLNGDARIFQKYRVDGRGAILVENVFVKMAGDYPEMPGFGTGFRLPSEYDEMEWYGREPGAGNEVGIYKGAINAYAEGDKQDVRWLRINRTDGYGLTVRQENNNLFQFSATREANQDGPLQLTIDLAREPLPFESMNFAYRIIPYISSAVSQ